MKGILITIIIGILVSGSIQGQDWKRYPYTPEGSLVSFPADEGRHPGESSEWWYMAGHLTGLETGNPYSFMVSYFYYPAFGYDGFRILNIARENTGEFFSDAQGLNYTSMSEDSLNIEATLMFGNSESWTYQIDNSGRAKPFDYEVEAAAADGGLHLSSRSLKNPLILGDSGYFNQGASAYTYYYSFTENMINGSITFGDISEEVSGTAWIDKQYGTFSPASEEFYEWFSVNLSNGVDFVFWELFTIQNQIPDTSTYRHMSVWEDSTTQFTTHDFQLERLAYAYMPDGEMCYSQSWHLTSLEPQMDLIISTIHAHADVQLPFRFYEGATSITGTVNGASVTGRGFTELVKSYEAPEPAILYPQGGTWKDSLRLGWTLLNPDDGYNLSYDLEYSTDQGTTYEYIFQGLSANKYTWADPGSLERGDSCWFRLTAHSPDRTLLGSTSSSHPSIYEPDSTTSIEPDPSNRMPDFQIFPIPASELLTVKLDEQGSFRYSIYNSSGVLMSSGSEQHPAKQTKISISGMDPGIYMIVFETKEGYSRAKKFIIE